MGVLIDRLTLEEEEFFSKGPRAMIASWNLARGYVPLPGVIRCARAEGLTRAWRRAQDLLATSLP